MKFVVYCKMLHLTLQPTKQNALKYPINSASTGVYLVEKEKSQGRTTETEQYRSNLERWKQSGTPILFLRIKR